MKRREKNRVLFLGAALALACLMLIGAPIYLDHPNLPSLPKPIPLEYSNSPEGYLPPACSQFTGKCDKISAAKQAELRALLNDARLQPILAELDSAEFTIRVRAREALRGYLSSMTYENRTEMITALGCLVARNSQYSAEVKQSVLEAISLALGCGKEIPMCKGPIAPMEVTLAADCHSIDVSLADATGDYFFGPSCESVDRSIAKVVADYFTPIYRGCTTFQPVLIQPETPNACLEFIEGHCAFRPKSEPLSFIFINDPIKDQKSCAIARCKVSGGVLELCPPPPLDDPRVVPSLSDEPEADDTKVPSEREVLWNFSTYLENECFGADWDPVERLCCFRDPNLEPRPQHQNYWRPPYPLEGERDALINGIRQRVILAP